MVKFLFGIFYFHHLSRSKKACKKAAAKTCRSFKWSEMSSSSFVSSLIRGDVHAAAAAAVIALSQNRVGQNRIRMRRVLKEKFMRRLLDLIVSVTGLSIYWSTSV